MRGLIDVGKMKTKRAAAKRFKRTGSGKLTFMSPGQNHASMVKNAKRQRRLQAMDTLQTGDRKVIENLLPYM
jgi:large subunit ribosomal protein L35